MLLDWYDEFDRLDPEDDDEDIGAGVGDDTDAGTYTEYRYPLA